MSLANIFGIFLLCFGYLNAIYAPNENVNPKPLATMGIKTIGWQMAEAPAKSVVMHQNYSKVYKHPSTDRQAKMTGQEPEEFAGQQQLEDFTDQQTDFEGQNTEQIEFTGQQQQTKNFGYQNQNPTQTEYTRTAQNIGDWDIEPTYTEELAEDENYDCYETDTSNLNSQTNIEQTKNQYQPPQKAYQNFYSGKYQGGAVQVQIYSKCPSGLTGQFVYDLSCNQFLNCWNGRGFAQNCAPGTLFNPKTLECDFAEKVECISGPKSGSLKSEKLTTQATCPNGFSGVIPHYTDCNRFINCANGVEYVMDCPPGTLFDVKTNLCDFAHRAECVNAGIRGFATQRPVGSPAHRDSRFHNGYTNNFELNQPLQGYENVQIEQNYDDRSHTNNNHYRGKRGMVLQKKWTKIKVDPVIGSANNYGDGGAVTLDKQNWTAPDTYPDPTGQGTPLPGIQKTGNRTPLPDIYPPGNTTPLPDILQTGHRTPLPTCPRGFTGVMPHYTDCQRFISCTNGVGHVMDCPPGTLFDAKTNVCDFLPRVDCANAGIRGFTTQRPVGIPAHGYSKFDNGYTNNLEQNYDDRSHKNNNHYREKRSTILQKNWTRIKVDPVVGSVNNYGEGGAVTLDKRNFTVPDTNPYPTGQGTPSPDIQQTWYTTPLPDIYQTGHRIPVPDTYKTGYRTPLPNIYQTGHRTQSPNIYQPGQRKPPPDIFAKTFYDDGNPDGGKVTNDFQPGGRFPQPRPFTPTNQQGFPGQSGGTNQQGLPGQSGSTNQQGYPGQSGGTNQQGYPGQSGGTNQQGYPGQSGGTNQQGYPEQSGGTNQQGFPGQSGGTNQQGYPGQSSGTNHQGYPRQSGVSNQPAYNPQIPNQQGQTGTPLPTCPRGFTGLLPHYTDCHMFINCAYGVRHVMHCPFGTEFIAKRTACEISPRVECADIRGFTTQKPVGIPAHGDSRFDNGYTNIVQLNQSSPGYENRQIEQNYDTSHTNYNHYREKRFTILQKNWTGIKVDPGIGSVNNYGEGGAVTLDKRNFTVPDTYPYPTGPETPLPGVQQTGNRKPLPDRQQTGHRTPDTYQTGHGTPSPNIYQTGHRTQSPNIYQPGHRNPPPDIFAKTYYEDGYPDGGKGRNDFQTGGRFPQVTGQPNTTRRTDYPNQPNYNGGQYPPQNVGPTGTNQQGYPGQYGGSNQQGYPGQSGGTNQEGYPGQSGGTNQQGYLGQSGGTNQQGYPGQSGGTNQQGYPGQSGGTNQQGFPGQSGGTNQQGYPGQSGGTNQQGFPGQSGGTYQQGYPGQSNVTNQQGYPGQSGGSNQPAYNPQIPNQQGQTGHRTPLPTCSRGFTGVLPHYTDCHKFINCANGARHVMDCPPGTLFDVKTNVCDFSIRVECANSKQNYDDTSHTNNHYRGKRFTVLQKKWTRFKVDPVIGSINNYGEGGAVTLDKRNFTVHDTYPYPPGQETPLPEVQETEHRPPSYQTGHRTPLPNISGHQTGHRTQSPNIYQTGRRNPPPNIFEETFYEDGYPDGGKGRHDFQAGGRFPQGTGQPGYGARPFTPTTTGRTDYPNQPNSNGIRYSPQNVGPTDNNQQGFPGQSGGTNQQGYPAQTGGTNRQGYRGQSRGTNQQGYRGQSGWTNQQGYSGQSRGTNQQGYPAQSGGTNQRGFPVQSGGWYQQGRTARRPCPSRPNSGRQPTKSNVGRIYYHNQQGSGAAQTTNSYQAGYAGQTGNSEPQSNQNPAPGNTNQQGYGTVDPHAPRNNQGGQYADQNSNHGVPKCPQGASGHLPHPYDCAKFLNCNNGMTFIQDCAPGTHFNKATNMCDFPYNANCQQDSNNQQLDPNYIRSTNPQTVDVNRQNRESQDDLNFGESNNQYQTHGGRNIHSTNRPPSSQTPYGDIIEKDGPFSTKQQHSRPSHDHATEAPNGQQTGKSHHLATKQDGSVSMQWPPMFPTSDPNADYFFEYQDSIDLATLPNSNNKKDWCDYTGFECGNKICISPSNVCDGTKDCQNGKDELNCAKYLSDFLVTANAALAVKELEKHLNVTLASCAKFCRETTRFDCKSFNFRKQDGTCYLLNNNVATTGALMISQNNDYFECKKHAIDCNNMYTCQNKRCIDLKQVCDGVNDCGDGLDEKNCKAEAFGYNISLAGSTKKNEGRIEIQAFGKTGYICDDMFGQSSADVACRELGFDLGALEVKPNSYYAENVDENAVFYMMDNVKCLGNETSLKDCDFSGWGVNDCAAQEIVGVVCKIRQAECPKDHWQCENEQECLPLAFVCDGVFDCSDKSDESDSDCNAPVELRLADGFSKKDGRVEIKYRGTWGTICDDDFNDDAAKVVCRHLGFSGSAAVRKDSYYGPGQGPIWLDQVFCQGNESALQDCVHWDWGTHNCEHTEDVGVTCSSSETEGKPRNSKTLENIIDTPVLPTVCGLRSDAIFTENSDVHFRVVSGSKAKIGDYPWQASIRVKGKSKSSHWCGAVVISEKFVATAAHCLVGYSKGAYFIVAGDYNVDISEGSEQEVYIEDFLIHEEFRAGNKMNNDIAIVKLKGTGFNLTKDVQAICLPDINTDYSQDLNCTISGFGSIESGKATASHDLRAGWIPIQSPQVCKMPHVYGSSITENMICAGSLTEGVDACDGDSGGPLACLHDGVFKLYGITSWGHHCGHANKPGVYVKVAKYRDWIEKSMQKLSK